MRPGRQGVCVDHRPPAGEGTLFTFGPDPRNKPTANGHRLSVFQGQGHRSRRATRFYTYAAMQVWSQAVAKAGTTDAKKVRTTIKGGAWDTVIRQRWTSMPRGDIKQIDYVVYKWDAKGNYTPRSTPRARKGLSNASRRLSAPGSPGPFFVCGRKPRFDKG